MFNRILALAGLMLLAIVLVVIAAPAYAATVDIPWGDWLVSVLGYVLPVIAAAVLLAVTRLLFLLPGPLQSVARTFLTEQTLNRAIGWALNAVSGAAKGQKVTVNVANEVISEAVAYVVAHAPGWFMSWIGGDAALREKIIARLDLAPNAAVTTLATGAPAVVAATP